MPNGAKIGPLKGGTISKNSNSVCYEDDSELEMPALIRTVPRICEVVNCFALATTTIEVKVGYQRTISLSLCNDCADKFRDEG